jgi:hypothetical protein
MVGTMHVAPLVTCRLDRVTLGLPCRLSSLNAISCTFKDHYNNGVELFAHAEDVLLKDTYRTFQQALRDFLFEHPQVHAWKPLNGKCPRQTFELFDDDGQRAALIHVGSTYGTPYTHFEFNPSTMKQAGRMAFRNLLANVLADGYSSLYEHGVLSPAELAVDIDGLHCADSVLINLGKRRTRPYKDTDMVYCGRRGGPLQGKLYDWAKKNKKTFIRTRWETVITDRKTTLRQFIEEPYPCPMKDFRLVRLHTLKECLKAAGLPTSLALHIRGKGLLKSIPDLKARKALIALLEQHTNSWGHPSGVWPSFQKMLERFKPVDHLSGSPLVVCTSTWDLGPVCTIDYADEIEYDV